MIIPDLNKTANAQPDYRVLAQGIEYRTGWTKKGETSGKEYVSLALAAPEFGLKKLYANLGRAAGQDDDTLYALIWNQSDNRSCIGVFKTSRERVRRNASRPNQTTRNPYPNYHECESVYDICKASPEIS
jgi:uncharacterized protein (DUF736 family)